MLSGEKGRKNMNTLLLIFFAIPIAVIIVSIALQKIFKCPFLVAAIIFAIFLVVTFIVGNLIFLVATIAYTILAFITAVITKIICRILRELDRRDDRDDDCRRERRRCSNNSGRQLLSISRDCSNNEDNGNLLTISINVCNGVENELLTINTSCRRRNDNDNDNDNDDCSCRCRRGTFCGCFRRR